MQICFDFAFNPKTERMYRFGKPFVYINGTVYYFTFRPQQSIDRPYLRIKDVAMKIEEVRSLPWDAVSSETRIVVGGVPGKRPTCIRLKFNGPQPNRLVFLSRSTYKRLSRDHLMLRMSNETKPAQAGDVECVICLSNASDSKFSPCGHSRFCGACALKCICTTARCPLCRKETDFFTRA